MLAGGVLFAAGLVWPVAFVSVGPDYLHDLLPSMVLGGSGVGLALGHADRRRRALAAGRPAATGSALVNSVRQVAATVGVAVLVTILGCSVDAGPVTDFRVAWAVGAVLSLATAGVGLLLARAPAEAPAEAWAPRRPRPRWKPRPSRSHRSLRLGSWASPPPAERALPARSSAARARGRGWGRGRTQERRS